MFLVPLQMRITILPVKYSLFLHSNVYVFLFQIAAEGIKKQPNLEVCLRDLWVNYSPFLHTHTPRQSKVFEGSQIHLIKN